MSLFFVVLAIAVALIFIALFLCKASRDIDYTITLVKATLEKFGKGKK